ncbi:MAG TPA: amino acid adenylation domain-containing protein [Pyrinomonadaceae bacterium]|jgi:amino acid adenylation domain-containing protein
MDLEKRIAQLSPAKLALLEQKLKKNKPQTRPKAEVQNEPRQKYAPLSFSQERLWFLEQMDPDSCIYNLPAMLPLRGQINLGLVEETIRQIVERHSALRTRFVIRDDNPFQEIVDNVNEALDFSIIDLCVNHAKSNPRLLEQTLNSEIWVPFNLATGPLLRARLILQPNNENLLLLVMHHIISDGWSINIFTKEFQILYESAHRGNAPNLPPLPQQYVDYSISQRKLLQGDNLQSLLSYWRTRLNGAPPVLALPLDHQRPARQSFKGALYPFNISRSSLQKLNSICRECGVVPFMVLLSSFKILLFRYAHQSMIVVGTPIANRSHSELETVIGFFTNTLVLSSSLTPDMSFREFLAQVRDTTLGAYEHQELPFEKLVSELQPERSLSYNPLFQVMFTFQNLPTEKSSVKETAQPSDQPAEQLSLDVKISKFDLTLAMTETGDGLSAVFEYATDLFEAETVERMATHFVNILEYVLENPDEPLAGFSFLSLGEQQLILEEWNDTSRLWSEILPLHRRFERWVQKTPDAPAVIFRETALTYRQLDQRANRIAVLLQSNGVGAGSIVGICLPRSLEMVIGLFAILKAGAAYMPFEPDYPEARVAYMLDDAKVNYVLTVSECLPALSAHEVNVIALDEIEFEPGEEDDVAPPVDLKPDNLAYVLFTSGSTGQPKGVMVSHGAIHNRLQWMQAEYNLQTNDRVMQKTPFTFDVSVWEFFWTLSEGACLVVAEPDRHKESAYLVELIKKQQVTCMHFVPSMLQLFLHENLAGCDSLNRIICSGEALTVEQCRRLQALPSVSAHNLYGPTEAAVDVTYWDCAEWRDQYLSVPIGRPIANTQIYILNEKFQPAPIGVAGELYIGGHNLAEGYLNKPELTERQFVKNPFAAGTRLYKTGDFARFRSDGNIEYLGRIDSQVKLRGLRIELGEIESLLSLYPGIAEAVVVIRQFDKYDERLVAYVELENPEDALDTGAVSAFLGKNLPNYMVPANIMTIAQLPLTPNGKLDRKRLPQPTAARASKAIEPASDIEKELLAIWRKSLKVEDLKTNDDFFALGGHSILVTQVINSINRHYHLDVPVRLLFENPTVQTLAKALSEFEDEVWLDESKMASAILTRSERRLLETLDELTEDQIDDFLKEQLEAPSMKDFDDVESLLAWVRNCQTSDNAKPKSVATDANVSSENGHESLKSIYLKYYFELARTKAEIDSVYRRRFNPFAVLSASDETNDPVEKLQDKGNQIFEIYTREIKQRLSGNGSMEMAPADLRDCCSQLMTMAGLAASFKPFRLNGRSPDKR